MEDPIENHPSLSKRNAGEQPRKDGNTNCLNCGSPLTGQFCAHCGQKDLPQRQTLGELITNFIGSFTSFESKFFKTLTNLLFKPGFLPMEYNAGRRETYYHPARAYVFISFIFFLLMFSLPEVHNDPDNTGWNYNYKLNEEDLLEFKSTDHYDSVQQTLPEKERDGWFVRYMKHRAIELDKRYQGRTDQFSDEFSQAFLSNFPKVLFLLLPIFALLLKLLYIKHDYYYTEHLVFSIFYYNFFYLAASIAAIVGLISWLKWIEVIIGIWIVIYLLLAMKKMYKQPWGKTILKYFLLALSFSLCMIVGILINMFITLFFI